MEAKHETSNLGLKEIFEEGFSLFKKVDSDELPSNSKEYQENVSEAISCLRATVERVNDLALFSKNEELDDISTSNLRYLLLPSLLGDLYLKLCSSERIDAVKMAKTYFLDYLERCKLYRIISQDVKFDQCTDKTNSTIQRNLEYLANERQAKITRYKKIKEQEKIIKELSKVLETSSLLPDEELQRKHNVLLLEYWINKSLDQISSINSELEILEHMEQRKRQGNIAESQKNESVQRKVLPKPILITREFIQNKVFGAGYPSLPTMTQEEYFEKELREGKIVTEFREQSSAVEADKEEEDPKCSEDDLTKLKKDRDWDDWKDDHRRGWGNRENMG